MKVCHLLFAAAALGLQIGPAAAADPPRYPQRREVKEFIAGQGAEVTTSSSQEFADLVKHDNALYAKIVKDANIRIEQ